MNRLRLADGRQIAWQEAGAGPPLLLLHGWSMSSAVFAEALAFFSSEYHVFAPDLRGHGGSGDGPGHTLGDFAGDIDEWLSRLDLRQAAAVGWSLGGQIILELAAGGESCRFTHLVLVGVTPRFVAGDDWQGGLPEAQVRAMARDLRRNYLRTMDDFFNLQFAGEGLPRERLRQIAAFSVRQGCLPEPAVALAALETLRTADQRSLVPAISQPVLVVHGGLDRVVPAAAGLWLADRLPQGRIALLPEAGHAPFLSRPEEVFSQWRDFLRS